MPIFSICWFAHPLFRGQPRDTTGTKRAKRSAHSLIHPAVAIDGDLTGTADPRKGRRSKGGHWRKLELEKKDGVREGASSFWAIYLRSGLGHLMRRSSLLAWRTCMREQAAVESRFVLLR